MHPDLYDQPENMRISILYFPKEMKTPLTTKIKWTGGIPSHLNMD